MKTNHLTAAMALALLTLAAPLATADNFPAPLPPIGETDVPGDFNEDAMPDLLWQNINTRELGVWLMRDLKPASAALLQSAAAARDLVAVGTDDFNGDNRTDAVLWNPATGDLTFWFLDGFTVVGTEDVALGLPGHRPASMLDHNRDGNPDILFQNYKTGAEITVVLFNGTTVIGKERIDLPSPEVDLSWQVAGSSDFDRDGDPDLVLTRDGAANDSRNSGMVAVAIMDGNVGTVHEVTALTDRNWVIGAVSDFTSDDWPDIFFENVATGETGAWEMRGLKIVATYLVTGGSTSRRQWRLVGPR